MTTSDDLYVMTLEIDQGRRPEESQLAPLTPDQRKDWDELVVEIDAIHARGLGVDHQELH